MKKALFLTLSAVAICSLPALPVWSQNPPEWEVQTPASYYSQDRRYHTTLLGEAGMLIEGLAHGTDHFTSRTECFDAAPWRGRLKLSAEIRAERLEGWAGIWMRVDGPDNKVLAFDNMQDRAVTGTLPWRNAEVVLEVPPQAERICKGFLISGHGKAWARNLKYQKAVSAPVTGTSHEPQDQPQNLELK